ncbi:XRE family transcriptional regulator [Segatella oris]|uniref:XRE family transcriptional regulator n=1 Tax=Segatella oris TaxID=28135 RepID=UPI0028ED976B|nr:XRE family transcriptional regulator [Segatella oris]
MSNNRKSKRWTFEDIAFVKRNLGKVSLKDMASHLKRSPMSVRLYILRNRLTPGPLVKRNLLMEMLKLKFRHPEEFTPTRAFYKETGIGQRRWWDLYYGRKSITGKEYTAVAEYLGITIQEAFESRQLELFEEK